MTEHERLEARREEYEAIADFIEWLYDKTDSVGIHESKMREFIARYLGIDLTKFDNEISTFRIVPKVSSEASVTEDGLFDPNAEGWVSDTADGLVNSYYHPYAPWRFGRIESNPHKFALETYDLDEGSRQRVYCGGRPTRVTVHAIIADNSPTEAVTVEQS